jgi:hypothetical protein
VLALEKASGLEFETVPVLRQPVRELASGPGLALAERPGYPELALSLLLSLSGLILMSFTI